MTAATMTNPKDCDKYLPADNPQRSERDLTIIKQRAAGHSYGRIAKELGLTKSRIHQIAQNEELQKMVEHTRATMTAMAQEIGNKHLDFIFQDKVNGMKIVPGVRLEAIKEAEKIVGISPTHTHNTTINQIYQDNSQNTYIMPVRAALADRLDMITDKYNEDNNGAHIGNNDTDNIYDAEIIDDND